MKGQVSFEYVIILTIMFLLLSAVSLDLLSSSVADTIVYQDDGILRSATTNIAQQVTRLKMEGPGAARSVLTRAPYDCDLIVLPTMITADCAAGTPGYILDGRILANEPGVRFNTTDGTGLIKKRNVGQIVIRKV